MVSSSHFNLLIILFLVFTFCYPASALAARDFQNCKILEIVVAGAQNSHVRMNCHVEPRPACASAGTWFGFDKSTEEGKQYLSIALTAYSTNSNVSGYVHNTLCSPYQGNVSWLRHIRMTK